MKTLHDLLVNLDSGCASAQAEDFVVAGNHWKAAFIDLEILVKGQYHDIVPNLIQKITDVRRQGLPDLAEKLQQHIAKCSNVLLKPRIDCKP